MQTKISREFLAKALSAFDKYKAIRIISIAAFVKMITGLRQGTESL